MPPKVVVEKTMEQMRKDAKVREKEAQRRALEVMYAKIQFLCLLTFTLVTPAVVLSVQANGDQAGCGEAEVKCKKRCVDMYSKINRVFASQMIPEQRCITACEEGAKSCMAGGDALYWSAGLLAGGLVVAFFLFWLLQAIMNDDSDAAKLANKKPRPAYVEPVFTEEEQRKKQLKANAFAMMAPMTEVKCLDCDIKVPVSNFWLPENGCKKGGMESSICSRCRRPVVGLL